MINNKGQCTKPCGTPHGMVSVCGIEIDYIVQIVFYLIDSCETSLENVLECHIIPSFLIISYD